MVKKFAEKDFDGVKLNHDGLVLVDFYADWCVPCKMLAPILDEIANDRDDVVVAKVNIDENMSVASAFNIASIPAMYVFKDGEVEARIVGFHSMEKINNILDGCLYGV